MAKKKKLDEMPSASKAAEALEQDPAPGVNVEEAECSEPKEFIRADLVETIADVAAKLKASPCTPEQYPQIVRAIKCLSNAMQSLEVQ